MAVESAVLLSCVKQTLSRTHFTCSSSAIESDPLGTLASWGMCSRFHASAVKSIGRRHGKPVVSLARAQIARWRSSRADVGPISDMCDMLPII